MESDRVCRTCLRVFSVDMVTSLDHMDQSDQVALRQKLESCVPQVAVDIVHDPVICAVCRTSISLAYQFRTSCLDNEKILYTYVRQRKQNSYDLLTTVDLLQIAHKNISNEHSYSVAPKCFSSNSDSEISKTVVNQSSEPKIHKTPLRPSMRTKAECKQTKTHEKDLGPVEEDVLQIKRSLQALDGASVPESCSPQMNRSCSEENVKPEEPAVKKHLDIVEAPPQLATQSMEEIMEVIHGDGTNNGLKEDKTRQTKERTCRRRVKRTPKKIPLDQRNELLIKRMEGKISDKIRADKLSHESKKQINGWSSNSTSVKEVKSESKAKTELPVTNGTIANGMASKPPKQKECESEAAPRSKLKRVVKVENKAKTENIEDEVVKLSKTKKTDKSSVAEASLQEIKSEPKAKYQCTKCDKAYDYRCHFDVHLRSHTVKKLFSCPTCGKDFSQETYLKTHTAIHKGSSYFQCRICLKRLSAATALKRHYRTHTGEKPFKCTHCQKQFTQKVQLEVHMRTHTGQKPYTCGVCQAAFKQKIHLLGHVRVHTGERPFHCNKCPKTFSRSQALQIHLRSHSKKPYQCKACNFLFKDGEVFRKHVGKHLASFNKTGSYSLKPHKYLGKLNEIEQDVVDINMAIYLSDQIKNEMFQNEEAETSSKSKFYCDVCHRKLANKYSMSRHVKIHQKQTASEKEAEHTSDDG